MRREKPKDLIEFQVPISNIETKGKSIIIEGYASTPELDSYNDEVPADVFKKGSALKRYMENPIILLGHNHDKAIGVMTDNKVDSGGRWIKAEIKYNIDNIFEQILDGVTKGFSIGFLPKKISMYRMEDNKPLEELTQEELGKLDYFQDIKRVIEELEIFEVSVVNIPANPGTLFSLSKALKAFFNNYDYTMEKKHMEAQEVEKKEAEAVEEEQKAEEVEETTEEEAVEEEQKAEDDNGEEVENDEVENTKTAENADDQTPSEREKSIKLLEEKVANLEDALNASNDFTEKLLDAYEELTNLVKRPVNRGKVYDASEQKEAQDPLRKSMQQARDKAVSA